MISEISNAFLKANFHSKGAELFSLKSNENEFIWNGNPKFWGKHSPILFPIVGTLKNNSFCFKNKNYSLPRHGFARDLEFEIKNKTSNSIIFSLRANDKTLENYPFEFELQIKYKLIDKSLKISFEVINNSDDKMPFSIGAHPAFSLPNGFENYSLEFSDNEVLNYHLLENGLVVDKTETLLLNDKKLKLKYKTFEKDALVFKNLKSTSITIIENNNPIIKVNFNQFPNLGLWTVQNADFMCIEPWFGFSDTTISKNNLFEKEGIIILEKNETFKTDYSIEIL